MKKITTLAIIALVLTSCNNKKGGSNVEMTSEIDSVSYAYGQLLAKDMESNNFPELNSEMMFKAFNDYNENGDEAMAFKAGEAEQVFKAFSRRILSKRNGEDGKEFLARNKDIEGVTTLPSGLQYKVIKPGNGDSPQSTDTVLCNYVGHFLSGEVFDASPDGEPRKFAVNKVIKGWTEALQLMKTGDQWILYIPSDLAYGEWGSQAIPPNSSLIFELELVDIIR